MQYYSSATRAVVQFCDRQPSFIRSQILLELTLRFDLLLCASHHSLVRAAQCQKQQKAMAATEFFMVFGLEGRMRKGKCRLSLHIASLTLLHSDVPFFADNV